MEASMWTDYLDTDLRATVRMDAMLEHRIGSQEIATRKTDPDLERNLAKWKSL